MAYRTHGIGKNKKIKAERMKPSRTSWITNKYPLIEANMNRSNCISYLKKHGNEYKVQVVQKAVREYMGLKKFQRVKEPVEMWLGISCDEATRKKDKRSLTGIVKGGI